MGADLGGRPRARRRAESGLDPVLINLEPTGPTGPDPDQAEPVAVLFDPPAATAVAADQLGAYIADHDRRKAEEQRRLWTWAALGFAAGWFLARK
jgi:hypothetical protein